MVAPNRSKNHMELNPGLGLLRREIRSVRKSVVCCKLMM